MRLCSGLAAILSTCLLANSSFAESTLATPNKPSFAGGYARLGLGINGAQFGINNSSSFAAAQVAPLTATSSQLQKEMAISALAELAIGYRAMLSKRFYLGGEGYLALARQKISNNLSLVNSIPIGINDLKSFNKQLSTLSGGLAIEPSWIVAPRTLFHGILGWDITRESVSNNQSVQITNVVTGSQVKENSHYLNGLKLGVGFVQRLNSKLSVGVRYAYINYFNAGGLNSGIANTTATAPNLSGPFWYNLARSTVSRQTVLANVIYHWDNPQVGVDANSLSEQGFSGYYISPKIGISSFNPQGNQANISGQFVDIGSIVNPIQLTSGAATSASTVFNIALGRGKVFSNHLYFGAEASLSKDAQNLNQSLIHGFRPATVPGGAGQVQNVITNQSTVDSWAVQPNFDVKLGYSTNQLLGYVTAGIGINKLAYQSTTSLTYFNDNNNQQTFTVNSRIQKGTKAHLRLGVGIEYQFSDRNSFSLNYRYTNYGKFNVANTLNTTDGAGRALSLTDRRSFTLTNNSLTLGYSHYFDGTNA